MEDLEAEFGVTGATTCVAVLQELQPLLEEAMHLTEELKGERLVRSTARGASSKLSIIYIYRYVCLSFRPYFIWIKVYVVHIVYKRRS